MVQNEFIEEEIKSSIYIFNTYLIDKIKTNKKNEKMDFDPANFEQLYQSVKKVPNSSSSYTLIKFIICNKWTKDIDIFEKDFLIFPSHDKNQKHWTLVIVCYPKYFLNKKGTHSHSAS